MCLFITTDQEPLEKWELDSSSCLNIIKNTLEKNGALRSYKKDLKHEKNIEISESERKPDRHNLALYDYEE
jgi:hypothetical protein